MISIQKKELTCIVKHCLRINAGSFKKIWCFRLSPASGPVLLKLGCMLKLGQFSLVFYFACLLGHILLLCRSEFPKP